MEELFKEKARTIKIYLGTEAETDPYEHTTEATMLNPFPIKAIVTDLTATKAQYAMAGIVTDKAKEIIIEKKYEFLLLKSRKIDIGDVKNIIISQISQESPIDDSVTTKKIPEFYEGWKQNGRLQYRIEGDYLRAYIYIKKS